MKNIIFVLSFPFSVPFPPPALLFFLSAAAETLCPAVPTAGKPPKALGKIKKTQSHLIRDIYQTGLVPNPKRPKKKKKKMSQCCKCPKLGSQFLCVLLRAPAWCRHHGQMSATPKRSPERPGDSAAPTQAAALATPLISPEAGDEADAGGVDDGVGERPRNEPSLLALVKQSPRSISRLAAGWFGHGNDASRGKRLGPRDPARSCLSEPSCPGLV